MSKIIINNNKQCLFAYVYNNMYSCIDLERQKTMKNISRKTRELSFSLNNKMYNVRQVSVTD